MIYIWHVKVTGEFKHPKYIQTVQKKVILLSFIPPADTVDWEKLDPHMAAALLKQFLKELPDALFTHRLYSDFMSADGAQSLLLFRYKMGLGSVIRKAPARFALSKWVVMPSRCIVEHKVTEATTKSRSCDMPPLVTDLTCALVT
jgi:hypothetical protein